MARDELELFVQYPDGIYRCGKVVITGMKVLSISVSTASGEHVTYPKDGRVHRTKPGVSREFRERHPELSDVTFEVFDNLQVPSAGPPAGAMRANDLSTDAWIVPAPSTGTASLFAVVVG